MRAGSWLRGSVFPLQRIYLAGTKQYSSAGAKGWVALALLPAEQRKTPHAAAMRNDAYRCRQMHRCRQTHRHRVIVSSESGARQS